MRNLLLVAIASVMMMSCDENRVFSEHQDLSPQLEWKKEDSRSFKVPIENTEIAYNLSVSFRYITGYQFKVLNVQITEISPSGKEVVKDYGLKIRNEAGEYLGEAGGDIWDSEHLIEPNKKYEEKGTYTYKLPHIMPQDPLNFGMDIGVILDKVAVAK